MKWIPLATVLLATSLAINADAEPTICTCYGGYDPNVSPTFWYLTDYYGIPLEDGDYVYAAWAGPNGGINWPAYTGDLGAPTGDDVLLAEGEIYYSGFYIQVTVYDTVHPMQGDRIYCRIFDGPKGELTGNNYYGCSNLYTLEHVNGEEFYTGLHSTYHPFYDI